MHLNTRTFIEHTSPLLLKSDQGDLCLEAEQMTLTIGMLRKQETKEVHNPRYEVDEPSTKIFESDEGVMRSHIGKGHFLKTVLRFGARIPNNRPNSNCALGAILCLFIAPLLVLGPNTAWACSCGSWPSTAERFQESTDVFIATAMSVQYFSIQHLTEGKPGQDRGRQEAKIAIGEVFKGSGEGYDVIHTRVNFYPPDANENEWIATSCDHTGLHAGKSYIVFGTDKKVPYYSECVSEVEPLINQDRSELRRLRDRETQREGEVD